MKKALAIILAAILMTTTFAGCGNTATSESMPESKLPTSTEDKTDEKPEDKPYDGPNELSLYLPGFQNQDPHIWTWGTHVARMGIFQGLVKFDENMEVIMADATEVTPNADNTIWTVKLRQDLKWSDGTPLNANDYLYSFQRVIAPEALVGKTSAFFGGVPILNADEVRAGAKPFSDIGIKAIDDYTIEFTLNKADPTFSIRLTESWGLPVPKHTIEAHGDKWTEPANIVSNGPFVVTARDGDVHLTLARNENYPDEVALDGVHAYMGTQNQILAYKNGDINVATVTAGDMEAVLSDENLSKDLQMDDSSVVTYMGFINSSNDILHMNPKIRQAISVSIDREILARDINKDTMTPAQSLVFPGFADWADEVTYAGTTANVEQAQKLMTEAGFPNGEGLDEMTCLIAGTATATTLAVVDMVEKGTGIKIKIVNEEWAAYVKSRDMYHDNDGIYGFYIDGWNTAVADPAGSFANGQFNLLASNNPAAGQKELVAAKENGATADAKNEILKKHCKYEPAIAYSETLDSLTLEADAAVLDKTYKELEAARQIDCGFIPLYWNKSVKLVNPAIDGYVSNPLLLGAPLYFNDISIK